MQDAVMQDCSSDVYKRQAGIRDITGTLEPGKCADMIVVEKNPLEDRRVLRNVDMVIVQGKVIRAPKVKKKQMCIRDSI